MGTVTLTILVLLAGVPIFFYLVAPLIVGRTYRTKAEPAIVPGSPEKLAFFPGVVEFMKDSRARLEGLGFRHVTDSFVIASDDPAPPTTTYIQILVRPQEQDYATAIAVIGSAPDPNRRPMALAVELCRLLPDDRSLSTCNTDDPPSFPLSPKRQVFRLPGLSVEELYRAHLALVEREASGERCPSGPDGYRSGAFASDDGVIERARLAMAEEHEGARRAGLLRQEGSDYRLTLKGAYLLTWYQLWPIKGIRKAGLRAEARRVLARLATPPSSR